MNETVQWDEIKSYSPSHMIFQKAAESSQGAT
jgi:hypothetical protein